MKKVSLILTILLVVSTAVAVYFYNKIRILSQSPQTIAENEARDLISAVGRIILLPKDEVPTIATVSDPTKLVDQPFFKKAKIGDKVLMYPLAKKAFLYDPVNNKVLEVAPIINPTEGGGLDSTQDGSQGGLQENN